MQIRKEAQKDIAQRKLAFKPIGVVGHADIKVDFVQSSFVVAVIGSAPRRQV